MVSGLDVTRYRARLVLTIRTTTVITRIAPIAIMAHTHIGVTAAGITTCGAGTVICGAGGAGVTSTAGAALDVVVKAPLTQSLTTTVPLRALTLQ